jgi:diaminohydroxyphosphoribosylaminopyrimidine deaminase/5-amino-6-(5-phosphoribosylamino)uracil reductase
MDEVMLTDYQAMELAIAEAQKGAGLVSPNPQVGCVVLSAAGKLLSKGYHQKYGEAHAEVNALRGLSSEQLKGARVFVTLEPCAHEGKTPSCAKAIAQLPVKEIIFGLIDPNPQVAGLGAKILMAAGIKATEYQGPLKESLEEVCEHFLVNFRERRPFISVKVASSLDGRMALHTGESKWITGEGARRHAHYLRATHEATLVGQGTLEVDNPSLDIRHPDFPGKKNKVMVLLGKKYSHLRPLELNVLKTHKVDEVFFLAKATEGYSRLKIDSNGTLVQPQEPQFFNKNLTQVGVDSESGPSSILIEGGSQVLSSFIREKRADRLYVFQAPILLGAKDSKTWTEGIRIDSMSSKISLRNPQVQRFGSDILITGRLAHEHGN